MLHCPGCLDWFIPPSTFPLCRICHDSLTYSHPHTITLTTGITVTALYPITEQNYPIFKSWKQKGGSAWNKLILKQLRKTKNNFDLIVPIPQQFARSWKMRGGSSHRFSENVRHGFKIDSIEALSFKESTSEKKAMQGLFERMTSENSFKLKPNAHQLIAGKRILLTDDFLTSGKTILDAISLLNQAGVAGVSVLVLASAKSPPNTSSAAC